MGEGIARRRPACGGVIQPAIDRMAGVIITMMVL
jgi:hypothetical protein